MGLALGGGEAGEKESLTCALVFVRTATGHGSQCAVGCLVSNFETTRALYREPGARKVVAAPSNRRQMAREASGYSRWTHFEPDSSAAHIPLLTSPRPYGAMLASLLASLLLASVTLLLTSITYEKFAARIAAHIAAHMHVSSACEQRCEQRCSHRCSHVSSTLLASLLASAARSSLLASV